MYFVLNGWLSCRPYSPSTKHNHTENMTLVKKHIYETQHDNSHRTASLGGWTWIQQMCQSHD